MSKARNFRLAAAVTFILACVSIAFRIFVVTNYVEPDTGLFVYGTSADKIFTAFILILLIFSVLIALMLKGAELSLPRKRNALNTFCLSLCGFIFLYNLVPDVVSVAEKNSLSIHGALPSTVANLCTVLQIVLAVCSAVYFFMSCSCKTKEKNAVNAILSASPVCYFALKLITYFIDTSRLMNTAERNLSVITQCLTIIFFLYEMQNNLPSKEKDNAHTYIFFAVSCTVFSLTLALPNLFLTSFWLYTSEFSYSYYITYMVIGIYAFSKVLSLCFKKA